VTKAPTFATEADLCAAFIARLGDGWVAYAETEGWDILLARRSDGCQVGIEAKLKLNAHVLAQSLEGLARNWREIGPDYRAVLVPQYAEVRGVKEIAHHIGIGVLSMPVDGHGGSYSRLPTAPHTWVNDSWHEWAPSERHKLPEFVPDVAAGASGPVQLSDWKVRALRLLAILEIRGVVHRADFKALSLDPRRWTDRFPGWLKPTPNGYVAGSLPPFRIQHPKVYAEIVATASEWMPPPTIAPPHQPSLIGGAA
jgi:hypothetical protein